METIPGGIYQGADGSYHDANGKPVKAPKEVEKPEAPETDEGNGGDVPLTESQPAGEVVTVETGIDADKPKRTRRAHS